MPGDAYFRAGVGLLVSNPAKHVLALERIDVPGSWQAPQGGIGEGEEPRAAAERELYEETRIPWEAVDLVDEHPQWLAYELPAHARSKKTGLGQVQKWFLLHYRGSDSNIRLDTGGDEKEFAGWRWMPMGHLVSAVWEVRRPVYQDLALRWKDHFA
ncbi:MAG TPA: RNA pyrophosphohydrolase [Acidimicrobiia bacterium]|nr:RNA pyrophosphohydrolase [Acidimicrobiia bacterium]